VIGILFMLYAPPSSGPRSRAGYAAPTLGFSFAPPPPAPYPIAAEGSAPIAPQTPFIPVAHSLSTDFSAEEPVREVRIRAKSPSPPPLPSVTPMPPLPAQKAPPLPKVAQTVAITSPRAESTPTTPPRLGVSAPSARARHLEPPRRMPPPMPRTRAARGSDAPPVPTFSTENQRTLPRELDDFSTAEHTFVD
jgi:hypothetical protein